MNLRNERWIFERLEKLESEVKAIEKRLARKHKEKKPVNKP